FAIIHLLATFIADLFKSPRRLEVENLFLRHQRSSSRLSSSSSSTSRLRRRLASPCRLRFKPLPTTASNRVLFAAMCLGREWHMLRCINPAAIGGKADIARPDCLGRRDRQLTALPCSITCQSANQVVPLRQINARMPR